MRKQTKWALTRDKIKTMVPKFIQAGCECFSEDQMDYIKKKYNSVITNKAVNGCILELKEYITKNLIRSDSESSFQKWILNLKTGKLEKRQYSKDYITWFINRDYKRQNNILTPSTLTSTRYTDSRG
jgi:hypothetical protein